MARARTGWWLTAMLAPAGCVADQVDTADSVGLGDSAAAYDTAECDDPPTDDEFARTFIDAYCPWVVTCAAAAVTYAGDPEQCRELWVRALGDQERCWRTCLLDECLPLIGDAAAAGECTDELYDQVWSECVERLDCDS